MALFSPPPRLDGKSGPHSPALRAAFQIVGVTALLAFLLFFAAMMSGTATSWWPFFLPSGPIVGVIGMTGIALAFTIIALDWILLGRRISDWPSARARVTAVEIERVRVRRIQYRPKVRAQVIGTVGGREQEITLSMQVTWHTENAARRFLATRIANGECTVALEPWSERHFLLPWKTPIFLCLLMAAIPWVLVVATSFAFFGKLRKADAETHRSGTQPGHHSRQAEFLAAPPGQGFRHADKL